MSYLLWIFTFSTKKKKKKADTHSYTHTNMHTCNYMEKGKIREEQKTRNPKLQLQTIFKNWKASITKPEILISDLLIYKMKCVWAESFPQAQTLPGGYLRLRRFCDFFQKLVSSNFMYCADYSQGYCITYAVVQSPSDTHLFATSWSSLSLTFSQSLPKFMSIELVIPSNNLILCHPLRKKSCHVIFLLWKMICKFLWIGSYLDGVVTSVLMDVINENDRVA